MPDDSAPSTNGEAGAGQGQDLHESREAIDHETAVEQDQRLARQPENQRAGSDQQQHRERIDQAGRAVAGEGAQHQQQHAADGERDLGQQRLQDREFGGKRHHGVTAFAAASSTR
jgi:hypothetical protein